MAHDIRLAPALALLAALGLAPAACGDDTSTSASGSDSDSDSDSGTDTDSTTAGETTTADTSTGTPSGTDSDSETGTSDPSGTGSTDPTTTDPSTTDPSTTTTGTTDPSTTDPVTSTTGPELCVEDPDCEGDPNGPVCGPEGECVQCTPENDPCGQGNYCDPVLNECTEGCLNDQHCPPDAHCIDGHFCLVNATSCKHWLELGFFGDGDYKIDPDGDGPLPEFETFCDMTTDGGGWTEITPAIACADVLGGEMIAVEAAPTEGIDMECRPFTRDQNGNHTYHYTFQWPPGFDEFYLQDYRLKANGSGQGHTADIYPMNFVQIDWTLAYKPGGTGDVSFGAAEDAGPTTSYAATLAQNFDCFDCELDWPAGTTIYPVPVSSTAFRIGWGEAGGQQEGFFPWWSGTIRIR